MLRKSCARHWSLLAFKKRQYHALVKDTNRKVFATEFPRNIANSLSLVHTSADSNSERSKKIVKIALVGNAMITSAKILCWLSTGSSAMLSEAIHSLVDSGNQALLLIGLRNADSQPDKKHPYGYGKSIYFWSLVSALGTFWAGAGISAWHSIEHIISPAVNLHSIGWEIWSVLGFSFAVDGWVLAKTLGHLIETKPNDISLLNHIKNIRDPTTLAVLMEDAAACTGVLIAVGGIGASQYTGLTVFDGIAGLGISGILASMGIYLARLNQRFLLGQSVDKEITENIKKILLARSSIEEVHSEQSQWIGPNGFIFKAEVDFDGTWLAAKLLRRYQDEFMSEKKLSSDEVKLLLSWYAEDVMRAVEQEVKDVETQIRLSYPEAVFIELEPDSRKQFSYAIDDSIKETSLRAVEIETINKYQKSQKDFPHFN